MFILDTDCLSLLQRGNAESVIFQIRLNNLTPSEIATTIITYEEQMRGWLAVTKKAQSIDELVASYSRLFKHSETYKYIKVLEFDYSAATTYEQLRKEHRRLGAMDLKIAAIAISMQATLLSRNLKHFGEISHLRAEDWTV